MNKLYRSDYVTRDSIEKLLSDDEIGAISTASSLAYLEAGDEFVDLDQLDKGVQRARGTTGPMGSILPRRAVHAESWNKVLTHLAGHASGPSR